MNLLCDVCGNQLQMNEENKGAICTSCGMNYSAERLYRKQEDLQFTDEDIPFAEIEIVEDVIMSIEDVFPIFGKGTVIVGTIQCPTVSVGETVIINNSDYAVTALENNKKMIKSASRGMVVGMLVKGAGKSNFKRGDWVYKKV